MNSHPHPVVKARLFLLQRVCLALAGVAGTHTLLHAHPPSEVRMAYDFEDKALKLDMAHVTRDRKSHFIRRVDLSLNGEERDTIYFPFQKSRTTFETDISLEAEAGDVVYVKIYCGEGGTEEAELTIEEPEPEPESD